MIEIPLDKGHVAIVDDEDAHVTKYAWRVRISKGQRYAVRSARLNKGAENTKILLHREVLGITDPHVQVDHRNGDGLDCRRSNLRAATTRMNQGNSTIRRDNRSGLKGVRLNYRLWEARICTPGGRRSIGMFATAEEAARAYDDAAREVFGEFACVNFPVDGERPARPAAGSRSPEGTEGER